MQLEIAEVKSPIGTLAVVVRDGKLCRLEFDNRWTRIQRDLERRFGEVMLKKTSDPAGIVSRLKAYLKGDLKALESIRIDPGGTEFQQEVWNRLRRVKPGRTVSYGELAGMVGRPRAVRAVGGANGANPVPIVVPCHRVIGADGALTGFGGGMSRKEWLLRHEQAPFRPRSKGKKRQAALPFASS